MITRITQLIGGIEPDLAALADAERKRWCGDAVHLRGIIEFSNACDRNCAYCGLRVGNTRLQRYTMGLTEVLDVVGHAEASGVRTIVLQSGESHGAPMDDLADMVAAIKRTFDVAVTLCVGLKPFRAYQVWREAGADRYLLKHETASPHLYRRLHPDSDLDERLYGLAALRSLGYQVGTGCIVGLPGQGSDDLAADILLTRKLDVDMAAFGPLVPHPDTPLADTPAGDVDLSLRVIAAARLALGPVHIPATTALDAVAPDGRERALRWGANVIMANLTPDRYRSLYDIYPSDRSANSIEQVRAILDRLGRAPATGHGHSLKRQTPTGSRAGRVPSRHAPSAGGLSP